MKVPLIICVWLWLLAACLSFLSVIRAESTGDASIAGSHFPDLNFLISVPELEAKAKLAGSLAMILKAID